MTTKLHRLDMFLKEEDSEIAQALLFEHIQYGWEEENLPNNEILIRIHCEHKDTIENIRTQITQLYPYARFESSSIENKDWTEAWKQYFTPVHAGDFLVLPSWDKETEIPQGTYPIYIEPKSAFGTGHHATTALCLHAISRLNKKHSFTSSQNFLDLGCGTGILGIACHTLGMQGLFVDIDPIAVANTQENLLLNSIATGVSFDTGSIDIVHEKYEGKYDIVIANILADPLKMLADGIISAIKENGYLILSGILSSQAQAVCEAYAKLGKPEIIEAQDIPHLCPENIATNEIKPAETWVALIWEC